MATQPLAARSSSQFLDDRFQRLPGFRCANLRYRLDIGDKLLAGDLERLRGWGWLGG